MIDEYTRLLESAAEHGEGKVADAAVTKLIAHLRASGRVQMLSQIVRELRKVEARRTALAPRVEVARERERAAALREAAREGIVAKHAVVNPALIRGWRAQGGGVLVDRSAKQAFLDLYRRVTL